MYDDFHRWLEADEPSHSLAIEIGCGVGFHPIQWAKANPKGKILAIERTNEKFKKFLSRLNNHPHILNVYPAHAEANLLIPNLKIDNRVDEYFFLYPNPYPKHKHQNLRMAHSHLIDTVLSRLKLGGTITFATNIQSYAEELVSLESRHFKNAKIKLREKMNISASAVARSHFEKKYLLRGDICHNLVFERIE